MWRVIFLAKRCKAAFSKTANAWQHKQRRARCSTFRWVARLKWHYTPGLFKLLSCARHTRHERIFHFRMMRQNKQRSARCSTFRWVATKVALHSWPLQDLELAQTTWADVSISSATSSCGRTTTQASCHLPFRFHECCWRSSLIKLWARPRTYHAAKQPKNIVLPYRFARATWKDACFKLGKANEHAFGK